MGADEQLESIAEVASLGPEVWLRGGWAMDFFLGRVTRPHLDVDWFAWASDAGRLSAALTSRGYELLPEPAHDQQLDFARGELDLSFALITRDSAGNVIVAGGPWAGQRWPGGMLDWPGGRIGAVRCPIISPFAQIEIKRMMPVWVPGMPRRPKDAADITVLETALDQVDAVEPETAVPGR
ncbi:nucleotidyltransferase domain-containing protein [Actinoplanes philippinensis]|uniref:nucleotidyltransferase domain-containing protein n=1 Tax=Actinoplanes philippinensis TaxID=35752 RepID=UPI0033CB4D18